MTFYLRAGIDLVFSILIFGFSLYILLLVHSMVFWELPYVPTMRQARKTLRQYLQIKPTDKALDMGCGLGKMLLFFARYPIEVTGIERRWIIYRMAQLRLFFHFFKRGKVKVMRGDFFQHDLSPYTIIYAFHIPRLITKLAPKMEAEMHSGQTLISYKFPFPLSPEKFTEEKVQDAPESYFYIYRRK